ncbi:MAG: VanZ family protein [Clostridia bacterium]|nr:VanZ family protein [Clostridia bacterium]
MSAVYTFVYNLSIPLLCVLGLLILSGWTALALAVSRKNPRTWRWICRGALLVAVALIVGKTLMNRTVEYNLYFPQWNPLHSVILYWDQPQQWRAMFMNILLFAPLGGCLPYLLPGGPGRRVWGTVAVGAAISLAIEVVQQLTLIGCLQTEDWLLNTLGTLVGAVAYYAYTALSKRAKETNFVK